MGTYGVLKNLLTAASCGTGALACDLLVATAGEVRPVPRPGAFLDATSTIKYGVPELPSLQCRRDFFELFQQRALDVILFVPNLAFQGNNRCFSIRKKQSRGFGVLPPLQTCSEALNVTDIVGINLSTNFDP
jgi:hypothetical protein